MLLVPLVVALLSGCGGGGTESASPTGEAIPTGAGSTDVGPSSSSSGADLSALSTGDLVRAGLEDIEAYWTRTYPEVFAGQAYAPVSGGFRGYTADDYAGLEACGTFADNADNAFFCPGADVVAWDESPSAVVPKGREQFGDFATAVVMAHEMGHVIGDRTQGDGTKTVTGEQQADCYAGAWTASVVNGESPTFTADLTELDLATAGLLDLADPVGTDPAEGDSHGSAFDRIAAFQDGLENGPGSCAAYTDASVAARLVQVPFTDAVDERNNGNLPLEQTVQDSYADLEDFWASAFAANGQTWSSLTDLPVDQELMARVHRSVGDFAAAALIGHEYAREVQQSIGAPGSELDQNLQADCYTGVWSASIFLQDRPTSTFALSPGDLDEAVKALLFLGDPAGTVQDGTSTVGSAFLRVQAFRTGFLDGFEGCAAYTESAVSPSS